MTRPLHTISLLLAAVVVAAGCTRVVDGDATWPGAALSEVLLTAADIPSGAKYDRVIADPGATVSVNKQPAVAIGSMPSDPPGCADGMSARVAVTGKPGPENTARFIARFNGANIIVSVVRWSLDLDSIRAVAAKCAKYQVFFSEGERGTAMATEPVPETRDGVLAYKQTMTLPRGVSTTYMALANVGDFAVIATSFELRDPSVEATATMPKTFLDIVGAQVDKIRRN